jgi:eukaryotic-like serine/threonine-protein kinase
MTATIPPVRLPDRYRVAHRIAAGGMATVWAAEDTLLGRLVAVKVLGLHIAPDADARERFTREARAAARVSDHPHVVTIYDIGEYDGLPFIVMEHFAGGTVADRLRAGTPITRAQALSWLDDAASALDHAHRHGIVHRDVKPANLLLDEHGRLAVADFGIARMASETSGLTQTGQVLGTAAYISPEQALGREATAASDRYAFAVVAFELLTGERPFPGDTVAAQARAHVDADPPAASAVGSGDLPSSVDRPLWRGLDKDPERRWRTACSMVESLDEALGGAEDDPTVATRVLGAAPPRAPLPPRPPRQAAAPRKAAAPAPRRPVASGAGGGSGRGHRGERAVAPSPGRRRFSGVAIVAVVVTLLLGGAAVAAFMSGGDGGSGGSTTPRRQASAASTTAKKTKAKTKPKPAAKAPAQTAPSTTQEQQTQTGATPTAPASGSPSELQAQGHTLLGQGNYDGAITALSAAVKDCPVTQTDPCAYAYYDLGHALRLAGRPAEAIPVLQARLQNPNQRGAVESELQQAQKDAGQR